MWFGTSLTFSPYIFPLENPLTHTHTHTHTHTDTQTHMYMHTHNFDFSVNYGAHTPLFMFEFDSQ